MNIFSFHASASVLPIQLDQPGRLVLALALSTPGGRLVLAVFFFLVALFFGFVDGLRVMLGGRVDCVEDLNGRTWC